MMIFYKNELDFFKWRKIDMKIFLNVGYQFITLAILGQWVYICTCKYTNEYLEETEIQSQLTHILIQFH